MPDVLIFSSSKPSLAELPVTPGLPARPKGFQILGLQTEGTKHQTSDNDVTNLLTFFEDQLSVVI